MSRLLFQKTEDVQAARELVTTLDYEARMWFDYCTRAKARQPEPGTRAPKEVIALVKQLLQDEPSPIARTRLDEAEQSRPRYENLAHP